MEQRTIDYWEEMGSCNNAKTRDAILCGFRSEDRFDKAGRDDAQHLILPFISNTDVVLDVGCGVGRILKWVAPSCFRAFGIDISKNMINGAKKRLLKYKNTRFLKLPINLRFPFENRTFNFIYFYHVSEHLEREDLFKVLSEIHRCLKTNGAALIGFSLLSHPDNQSEFKKWVRYGDEAGVRSRFYTEPECMQFLDMVHLHCQYRIYIPGEFVIIVSKRNQNILGNHPYLRLFRQDGKK